MSIRSRLMVGIILGLSLLACNLPSALSPGNTSRSSNADSAETMSALLTPVQQMDDTSTTSCPIPPGSPSAPDLSNWTSIASELLAYFNDGGSAIALRETLVAQGRLPPDGLDLVQMDFTGDAFDDLVLSILSGDTDSLMPAGLLFFYGCEQEEYSLKYVSPDLQDFGLPIIVAARDLNGDGVADLLIRRDACGAHTCFAHVEVLMWDGTTLENRLDGITDDLPSPVIDLVETESSAAVEVQITASGINSAGAGPFRRFVRTWTWDPGRGIYTFTSETKLASNFRIHVLHDGDQAALDGDHEAALGFYNQVVEDAALDDWLAAEEGQQNLAAYAMFRRVLSHLLLNQTEQARQAFTLLSEAYSEAPIGSAYAEMARHFWTEYEATNDVARACLSAQAYATQHEAEILEPLYYGYANPVYTAAEICPFTP